jgi:peptidoglycan/xylan/chitin deacetylase (PgdA/CDA1 family)
MLSASLVRRGIKVAALPAGFRPVRAGDLVILLYHTIGAGTGDEIDTPLPLFEEHLAFLGGLGRRVRGLDEALARPNEASIAVSFDDGYADFHSNVLPLLVRHGVPAVLFLATSLVVEEGNRQVGAQRGLTWSQLAEAVSTGLVTIGSHTHGHVDLSRTTEQAAEEEMRRSKGLIEDRLGIACSHFAYPWAVGCAAADRAARRNFDSAALGWHTNRAGRIDPYSLGRTPVLCNDGRLFFRAKVRGRLDAEALAYRVLGRGPWRRP